MKLGIVSDMHATPEALRRALDDMPSVDRVLCAGDAISEYRFCAETVELLQQVEAWCIQGNHEMVLFGRGNPQYLKKCREEFSSDLLEFLASAPESLEFVDADARVLMVHGSPWLPFEEYILPSSRKLDQFAQLPYDFVILGHTHMPMIHQTGEVTVINPGSCSQPRDLEPQGSYALLDTETRHVEIRRVRLD